MEPFIIKFRQVVPEKLNNEICLNIEFKTILLKMIFKIMVIVNLQGITYLPILENLSLPGFSAD